MKVIPYLQGSNGKKFDIFTPLSEAIGVDLYQDVVEKDEPATKNMHRVVYKETLRIRSKLISKKDGESSLYENQ